MSNTYRDKKGGHVSRNTVGLSPAQKDGVVKPEYGHDYADGLGVSLRRKAKKRGSRIRRLADKVVINSYFV